MGQFEIPIRYTAAEYFALEARSEVRHEYFDGEIFAMAGGTKSHNLITQNIASQKELQQVLGPAKFKQLQANRRKMATEMQQRQK